MGVAGHAGHFCPVNPRCPAEYFPERRQQIAQVDLPDLAGLSGTDRGHTSGQAGCAEFCSLLLAVALKRGFLRLYRDFPTFNHFFPLRATIRTKKTPVNHAPGFWLVLQALSEHSRNMPMQIMDLTSARPFLYAAMRQASRPLSATPPMP